MLLIDVKLLIFNEIRKYHIYTFVLHRGFFQQPRGRVAPRWGRVAPYVYFPFAIFMFHVSFLYFNALIINYLETWNIVLVCFILCFNVSFQKHCGSDSKTLWERFKNTVGAIQKHCRSDLKTLWERFKNTEGAIDRSLSVFKNETWNIKWNIRVLCFIFLSNW